MRSNGVGEATKKRAKLDVGERRLVEKVARREGIARNLNLVHDKRLTMGDKVADRVAATVGSWRFIIIQSVTLALWIALNGLAWISHWDPYPFILLNLALSFQAAYSAPIIMMSQKRMAAKDRLAAEHDYEVNRNAETEIEDLHAKLDALRQAQWGELLELQGRQIALLERLCGPPNRDRAGVVESTADGKRKRVVRQEAGKTG
jgi:uncharacterized membrane protein